MRHREKGMKNFTQWYEAPYNQVLTLKVNNIEFEIKGKAEPAIIKK